MNLLARFNTNFPVIRNALLLILGSGIAQAIPLIFSPLLSRIYSPTHFGDFAFFTATVAIATMLATGLYELAILLPKYDRQAFQLLGLIIAIASFVSVLSLLLITILSLFGILSNFTQNETIFLMPLGIFINALFQGLNYWLNRKKSYIVLNVFRIAQSLVIVLVSLLCGIFGLKSCGMIIAYLVGGIIAILPLVNLLIRHHSVITLQGMKTMAQQYLKLPQIMLPTSGMNTAAGQTPVFMLNIFYQNATVGNFSFASRILTAPLSIISVALGQVFFKNLTEIDHAGGNNLRELFLRTASILVLVSMLIFIPLFYWGQLIFLSIFGPNWLEAGNFFQIIILGTAVRFVVSPLSTIFYVTNKLRLLAIWQTIYFVSTVSIFLIAAGMPIRNLLLIYSIHESVLYGIYFLLMLKALAKN